MRRRRRLPRGTARSTPNCGARENTQRQAHNLGPPIRNDGAVRMQAAFKRRRLKISLTMPIQDEDFLILKLVAA